MFYQCFDFINGLNNWYRGFLIGLLARFGYFYGIEGDKQAPGIGLDANVRQKRTKIDEFLRLVARFFQQLSLGCCDWCLVILDGSAGKTRYNPLNGVPILGFHQHRISGFEIGNNHHARVASFNIGIGIGVIPVKLKSIDFYSNPLVFEGSVR